MDCGDVCQLCGQGLLDETFVERLVTFPQHTTSRQRVTDGEAHKKRSPSIVWLAQNDQIALPAGP